MDMKHQIKIDKDNLDDVTVTVTMSLNIYDVRYGHTAFWKVKLYLRSGTIDCVSARETGIGCVVRLTIFFRSKRARSGAPRPPVTDAGGDPADTRKVHRGSSETGVSQHRGTEHSVQ